MVTTKIMKHWIYVCLCILAFSFTGCTAYKTFPQAARAGDTVALAVGSADGMNRANTTATFVSDSAPGSPIDLTSNIRSIFRLYADKNSQVYNPGSDAKSIVSNSGHEPWVTVVALDLPASLPLGPGEIQFTTTAVYPTIGSHINDFPVQIEIIPGTGSSSSFDYEFGIGQTQTGDLTALEGLPHAEVIPEFPQGTWPAYGAIEIKMHVPTSLGTALPPSLLRVWRDDLIVENGSDPSLMYNHDANEDLTVILLSAKGLLQYSDSRFSIKLTSSPYVPLSFSGTPTLTAVNYYDINGDSVAGPATADYSVELR